ncbi:MarR family transcriptional regulator [Natronococcus pandeyae]|uniref:MarR family transcriptional regulator n=1 Tax=Natronococcus pandeyae TaxID=2055836 RepID=A0A8J8Q2D2_9EURY|nr:MarR family transcriptional regulator [Natronococcus pandeyae]
MSEPSTGIDDVAFLTRSPHRVVALEALSDAPQDRDDLRAVTGSSSSTVRRLLREFEDRNWVERTGHHYQATQLGAFVARAMTAVIDRIETERRFREIWEHAPGEDDGFTIDMCIDATVTVAEPTNPYCTIDRFRSLLKAASEFRFVGPQVALVEPCLDELRNHLDDGLDLRVIDQPERAESFLRSHPEYTALLLEGDDPPVLVHDDLPTYGIVISDDRVAICCCDGDTGTVQAVIDTDAPAARQWAESAYERYLHEASPLDLE